MKIAVIDVGSNSVRLMLKSSFTQKKVAMTQLGKGLNLTGMLNRESMEASIQAIEEFQKEAQGYELYCFATEAVRSAGNGKAFVDEVKRRLDITVDVLTPEEEARAGYLGASEGRDNITVLDVGGASTEIVTARDDGLFAISLPIGAVRANDTCGEDISLIQKEVDRLFPEKIDLKERVVAIGGTATSIGAILAGSGRYSREEVHGRVVSVDEVEKVALELAKMPEEERSIRYPVLPLKRAKVMVSGAGVILSVMKKYQIQSIMLSDSDNAEGYLILRNYEN